MTRNVLFIGNSHLACVKVAMDTEPGLLGERSIDYLAFNDLQASEFGIADGIIQPPSNSSGSAVTSDAESRDVRVADYSGFVIVGMGLSLNLLASIYLSHRLLAHHRPGLHLLSRAAFDAAAA